jgi:hypothetical protein
MFVAKILTKARCLYGGHVPVHGSVMDDCAVIRYKPREGLYSSITLSKLNSISY